MNQAEQSNPLGRSVSAFALAGMLAGGTLAGWLSLVHSPSAQADVMTAIWLNIVIMLTALAVEARRRPYSLHLMHLLALFLFLGAPALFQYSVGRFGVAGPIQGMRGHVLPSVLAVMLWVIAYIVAYEVCHRPVRRTPGAVVRFLERPVTPFRTSVILVLALASLGYLATLGLFGAVTRASARDAIGQLEIVQSGFGTSGLIVYLVHHMLLRGFSIVALLAGVLLLARDRRSRSLPRILLVVAVGLGTLLTNNPFAMARMWFATSVIGFAAPFVLRRRATAWGLVLIAVGGLTVLPGLNQSRYTETFDELLDFLSIVSPITYLSTSSDVDSLGMLSLCHKWLSLNEYRLGVQELGAILFWVPRVVWPNKPVGTGGMVTEDLGFDFTNLAPPIMAETLVDFGFLGIPFVAAFLGFAFARLDQGYWNRDPGDDRVRMLDAIYPLWLGCVIYVTRGGLMSALGFTTAFTAWILPFIVGLSRSARVGRLRADQPEARSLSPSAGSAVTPAGPR